MRSSSARFLKDSPSWQNDAGGGRHCPVLASVLIQVEGRDGVVGDDHGAIYARGPDSRPRLVQQAAADVYGVAAIAEVDS